MLDPKNKENITIDEKINKSGKTWSDKISKFFDKIDILEMEPEQKAKVAVLVKQDAI
jgi:hypothetical protein